MPACRRPSRSACSASSSPSWRPSRADEGRHPLDGRRATAQRLRRGRSDRGLERQFERDKDDAARARRPAARRSTRPSAGRQHGAALPHPEGSRTTCPATSSSRRRELGAARPRRRGLARGVALRRVPPRAHEVEVARGIEASEPLIGYAPTIRVRDAAFDPLQKAQGVADVSFPYLKPGEPSRACDRLAARPRPARGTLAPPRPRIDASAPRTFLLSRIVGPVTPRPDRGSGLLPMDTAGAADHAAAELRQLFDSNEAELVVQPGTDAAVRLAHRSRRPMSADGVIVLGYTDTDILADELVGFGPEVEVRSPDRLRRAVSARLARVLALHADAGGGGPWLSRGAVWAVPSALCSCSPSCPTCSIGERSRSTRSQSTST